MKKVILMTAFSTVLFACNSDGGGQGGDTDTAGTNTPGIPNANGNIPDTTNAINLSTSDSTGTRPVDSVTTRMNDSTNKKK